MVLVCYYEAVIQEHVIIVNGSDQVIGYKERGTLAYEDIYRVSVLWVTNTRGEILLAQRKLTKKHHPGMWGPAVAGTNDKGETYESNIRKEAEEEIGLKKIKPSLGPKIRISDDYNHFTQYFCLTIDKAAEDFTIQENEVEQVKWYSRSELERALKDHPEAYLKGLDWCLENL